MIKKTVTYSMTVSHRKCVCKKSTKKNSWMKHLKRQTQSQAAMETAASINNISNNNPLGKEYSKVWWIW